MATFRWRAVVIPESHVSPPKVERKPPAPRQSRPPAPGVAAKSNFLSVKQRGAIHEFGHMLGLRDEYATAGGSPYWTTDKPSVMNVGETVQPRHFGPFAEWVTKVVGKKTGRKDCWYEAGGTSWTGNSGL
jgi:hypothetical protein